MAVIVSGCGRSGSNVVLEILRGSPSLKATKSPEDKKFWKRGTAYPRNYLSKCDTVYASRRDIKATMEADKNLRVIWSIRDPRDMLLSKLRRGVPRSAGGDCKVQADDATVFGALKDIFIMAQFYNFILSRWPGRVMAVKMEDCILYPETTAGEMAYRLGIKFAPQMADFPMRMRNPQKARRYGSRIHEDQVGLWRNWTSVYDGWVAEHFMTCEIEHAFRNLETVARMFEYELEQASVQYHSEAH